jgi:hypothetical protein
MLRRDTSRLLAQTLNRSQGIKSWEPFKTRNPAGTYSRLRVNSTIKCPWHVLWLEERHIAEILMPSHETKLTLMFPSWTEQWQIPNNPIWFEAEVEIKADMDLREVVLRLLDSLPTEFVRYRDIGSTGIIPFDFATKYKPNQTESRSNFEFLPYGRFHKGGVEFLEVLRRANRSWTLEEFQWLKDEQLIEEVPSKFFVVFLQGLGASGGTQEWINTLFGLASAQTLAVIKGCLIKEFLVFVRRYRNERVMQDWKGRGLDSVRALDSFLATRDSWRTNEIAVLINIWKWEASRLLSNRGFQQKVDKSWVKIDRGSRTNALADLV